MPDFTYSVQATLNCTNDSAGTRLNTVDLAFNVSGQKPLNWVDPDGNFLPAGVDALLTGFTMGLSGLIHTASQRSGMDSAALLRKAIGMLEEQFVEQVRTTPVYTMDTTTSHGTQPEEIP